MKKSLRIISMLLVLVMCFSLVLTSCGNTEENPPEVPEHECESKCPTCKKCTDKSCTEAACSQKCAGHNDPVVPTTNKLTIYWNYDEDITTATFWIWPENGDGKSYVLTKCDYGVKCEVDIPSHVTRVGFIAVYGCTSVGGSTWPGGTKDYDADRYVEMNGDVTIYLKRGDEKIYYSEDEALNARESITIAGITSLTTIKYTLPKAATISSLDKVKVLCGTDEVEVVELSSLGKKMSSGIITLAQELDLSKSYTLQIEGFESKIVIPTEVFDSEGFIANYTYDGDDLGAVIDGDSTTFKVWAPTASEVVLNLFEAGNDCDAYKTVEMVKGEKGVWSHTEANCGHGTYYTYSVTTSVGTQEAVDPYAKAAGVNGNRGMVVDLALTNPAGWNEDTYRTDIDSYSEAIIWEVHVRDFSNKIADAQNKGKYLAFTEHGLVNADGVPVGIDYLVSLGITHVHLLPVYDYASVDESRNDQFNWGYDPKNYNVPEGSYSTDPYNGEVRIKEFKQMVQALHDAGIGVIMDVVYNHTYDVNSNLNKVVPYYYYRYNYRTGAIASTSGCGNDTASERYMFSKYMVDSTSYWMNEYHLDGFRFDLMGIHDVNTMQKVESAVHKLNPNAIIYGEAWNMGGSTYDKSALATQPNINKINPTDDAIGGVAVFNDAIRDGLKGSVFEKTASGYISGAVSTDNWNKVLFGIKGGQGAGAGWTVPNSMVINYMSAHDNNTLWDKLLLSNPNDSDDDRNKMNNLGAAIIMVSKGTPFWQAGEEMLRTKGGDENSYKSSDEVNNIDWSVLKEGSREYETMLYYKGLIEMRKAFDIFTNNNTVITEETTADGVVILTYDDGNGGQALVVINPHNEDLSATIAGNWNLVANSEQAGSSVLATETGNVDADAIGIRVYVNDALLGK